MRRSFRSASVCAGFILACSEVAAAQLSIWFVGAGIQSAYPGEPSVTLSASRHMVRAERFGVRVEGGLAFGLAHTDKVCVFGSTECDTRQAGQLGELLATSSAFLLESANSPNVGATLGVGFYGSRWSGGALTGPSGAVIDKGKGWGPSGLAISVGAALLRPARIPLLIEAAIKRYDGASKRSVASLRISWTG